MHPPLLAVSSAALVLLAAGAIADGPRVWSFTPGQPVLVHGVPETDDADFMASCIAGSGAVEIMLTETIADLTLGAAVPVGMATDAGHAVTYSSRAAMNEEAGAFMPVVALPAGDPLFDWLARDGSLTVRVGDRRSYTVALAGSAKPVAAFVAACAK